MSLDVYLLDSTLCPNCGHEVVTEHEVFDANVTHNLGDMAEAAGIYYALWRPDELGYEHARDLIAPLLTGLTLLRSDPERFEKFNPSNGWGSYKDFVPWVEGYLAACENHPNARIKVSR